MAGEPGMLLRQSDPLYATVESLMMDSQQQRDTFPYVVSPDNPNVRQSDRALRSQCNVDQ